MGFLLMTVAAALVLLRVEWLFRLAKRGRAALTLIVMSWALVDAVWSGYENADHRFFAFSMSLLDSTCPSVLWRWASSGIRRSKEQLRNKALLVGEVIVLSPGADAGTRAVGSPEVGSPEVGSSSGRTVGEAEMALHSGPSETGERRWPRLSKEQRERVLEEFKRIQDGGLLQPSRDFPSPGISREPVARSSNLKEAESEAESLSDARRTWQGGVVTISADAAKLLFPEYVKDPTGADRDVASAAKAISDAALETVLQCAPQPDKEIALICVNSPGSGKTAMLTSPSDSTVGLRIDDNFDDLEEARKLMQRVIGSGRKPVILWVYVDEPGKTVERMFRRAAAIGRVDQLDYMAQAYYNVPRVLAELQRGFSGRLKVHVADNSAARGETMFIEDSSRIWSESDDAIAARVGLAQVDAMNRMFRENPEFEVNY